MDKIHLGGLTCLAKVGVFDWERRIGCPCEINLEISLDLSSAGKSDDLGDTLDYTALYSEIIGLAESCGFGSGQRRSETGTLAHSSGIGYEWTVIGCRLSVIGAPKTDNR